MDAKTTLRRSHDWTVRSLEAWKALRSQSIAPEWQSFFPIVQGGRFPELRRESAEMAASLDVPGIAVAGESIGADPGVSIETLEMVRDSLPREKPLYAMGLGGGPEGFLRGIAAGVDFFDNTSPSRLARCGIALIRPQAGGRPANRFRLDLRKGYHRADPNPIDPDCPCPVCSEGLSRAYIRHLVRQREASGMRLICIHNLWLMCMLGRQAQAAIANGEFAQLLKLWTSEFQS